jgi:DNA-binding winged helix-turn-helix (wHTH) protein/Tol biopolymer transport system component
MRESIVCFDQYELDLNSYELRKSGRVVKLEKLPTELLILLVEKRGQLVTREEIIQRLWGDNVFVDTRQGINTAIRKIRVALRDDPENPRLLETVAGRGYRLLAPLSSGDENAHEPPAPRLPTPSSFPPSIPPESSFTAVRWRYVFVAAIVFVALPTAVFWLSRREAAHPAIEQRITSNPPEAPVTNAVVSPDGKYLAYADPTGLYLRQINSGETRPWGLPKDFVAWPASWFPDSTHLLVARLEGVGRMPGVYWKPSLWKLSLLGGDPQKLMNAAGGGVVSPDGTRIAYLPGPKYGSELWVMNSDGANVRKIASVGKPDQTTERGRWIYPVVWSPSGKRLAYIERHGVTAPEPADDTFSLETRDANGGDLQVVLNDLRVAPAVWWAADGRILYAYREDPASERSDEGVYSIRVDERTGKAIGQPQPVTDAEGSIGGLSATSDGKRLVLWRVSSKPQVFIAEFKAGSHQLNTPRRLTLDMNGSMASEWTSDSKAVLFVSNRNGTWKLFKQKIDETTAEVLVEGHSIFFPRLSADGSQVLYLVASRPDDPASLMSKPLAGGPPRLVLQGKGIINLQCARTPSKLCIFSKLVGSDLIFASFDLEHGAGRELVRIPNGYLNWSLSPDGSRLAIFLERHRIRFLSLDTGVSHDVSVNNWTLFNGDWSADGKSVFMNSVSPEGRPAFLAVNEAGKAEVAFEGQPNATFHWMFPSPDGRYAILEEDIPGDNNAWMVDNF